MDCDPFFISNKKWAKIEIVWVIVHIYYMYIFYLVKMISVTEIIFFGLKMMVKKV